VIFTREPDYYPEAANFLESLGRKLLLSLRNAGRALLMLFEAIRWLPAVFARREEVMRQLYIGGIKSLGAVSVVALFSGMVLSLQMGLELQRYGQEASVGAIVATIMFREFGPFMTGLILAATIGSAMAAELGTMSVSEEIASLEVMSINPARFLIMPRVVAFALVCPLLTIYTNILGLFGGSVVSATQLGVSELAYYTSAIEFVENREVYVGLFKAFLFGILTATVSCHQGLMAYRGAEDVARGVRRAVIYSFLLILIVGYYVTRLFY
jgi:phospholipid/cholesterol/gamma-HCH transport system permease protein